MIFHLNLSKARILSEGKYQGNGIYNLHYAALITKLRFLGSRLFKISFTQGYVFIEFT